LSISALEGFNRHGSNNNAMRIYPSSVNIKRFSLRGIAATPQGLAETGFAIGTRIFVG